MRQIQTEREFQAAVVQLAKLSGWLVYHTHDSRRSVPGFPDLVLVRGRVIFAELKTDRGRVSPEQAQWLHALTVAGQHAVLWRPRDWDEIEATLTAGR